MIPPPFLHRFEGDPGIDIAHKEIDVVFPDGERRRIVLRIGAPYKHEGGFRIRSELENLDRTDGPLFGADLVHALVLGLAWLPARLEIFEQQHGCRYYYPNSDQPFDYRESFQPLNGGGKSV